MRRIQSKKLWAGTLAASVAGAFGLTLVTSSAPADTAEKGPGPAEIRMVLTQGPQFEGAESVAPGQELKIINKTKVQDIGPHFFSLFEEGSLPTTGKENRQCGKLKLPACINVAEAHRLSKQFEIRRRSVDKGADGWDTSFTDEVKGDSWFTDQKNESETRVVSPEVAGSTLYYLCLIHPQTMRGQIQVESPPR